MLVKGAPGVLSIEQNVAHFASDIFNCIYYNENSST